MKRTKKIILIACSVAAVLITAALFWAQQQCEETSVTFQENFSFTDYKDHTASAIAAWPPGPITLPRLGANFAMTEPGSMGARIYSCDAGDFTGDGYPDLIGLDISGQHDSSLPWRSRLLLIRNTYETLGDAQRFTLDPTKVFEEFNTHTAPASLAVADFNGDGLMDFFFMRNSADQLAGYTNFLAAMYINAGTVEDPVFLPHNQAPNLNFTAAFQDAGIYHSWTANHIAAVDIDGDGDMDLLVISRDQIFLVRNPGAADFSLENFSVTELNYDQRTGFTWPITVENRGGSSISAGDFDNDGDIDIIGGSVNDFPFLVYYENDGHGYFTRKEIAIPDSRCTGVTAIGAADFTNNGWPDIFAATDRWNVSDTAEYPDRSHARMWFLRNHGLKEVEVETIVVDEFGEEHTVIQTIMETDWEFICLNNCDPIIPPLYDVDMSAVLDYDQDGDMDVILADANHSGDYYLIVNELAEVFALTGRAQSTVVSEPGLNPNEHSITRARLTQLHMGTRGGVDDGLVVEIWFSNNDGQNWEFYARFAGAALQNYSNLPWHEFKHFGARLKWRALLFADEDEIFDPTGVPITGASINTPTVSQLQIEYVYVDRREYSRASAAATITTTGGESRRLIIASSFIFPGWEGQLRAYDVTQMPLQGGSGSNLRTVSSSDLGSDTGRTVAEGVEIFWDAGQLLRDRSHADRTVYTAIREGQDFTNPLLRVDFTEANAGTLAPQFFADLNNDHVGLINFVRGEGRDWKLGDINHSTPVVIGPPSEDALYMGHGYEDFKEAQKDRTKVVYVGANDGMLHCFDVATGEELWGFIPYNLLGKISEMRAVDSATGERYYDRKVYVDGTPSVADVQIGGQWRTVLVMGQGPGEGGAYAGPSGQQNRNYYFALDITDPDNPIPLWEFSHSVRSGQNWIPTVGETWSVPAIGKVKVGTTDTWVAFMGSGYNNYLPTQFPTVGNRFYVVSIDNGALLRERAVTNVNTASMGGGRGAYNYPDIPVTIPGSPTAFDADRNGYIDHVYFGDLDGRLWKLDVTSTGTNQWNISAVYTDYLYYPIVTKPAVWLPDLSGGGDPRIFFGTGGHEKGLGNYNPLNDLLPEREFSFVALIDDGGNNPPVEWYMGNPTVLNLSENLSVGTLLQGEKVWADPVLADFQVFFSTLRGSIESVNPCVDLEGSGRLYSRYIKSTAGVPVGGTAFKLSDGSTPESLTLVSKARRAVTVGEVRRDQGLNKREIYIQEYDSTIEMLEQGLGSVIQIKSWREVYKIIK